MEECKNCKFWKKHSNSEWNTSGECKELINNINLFVDTPIGFVLSAIETDAEFGCNKFESDNEWFEV